MFICMKKSFYRTDYLFAKGSFLIGMGNLLGIFSPYYSYNESSSAEAADRTALESDFGVVGQDLYSVMK
jgi:hypothetical protein